jgi:protein SCO1/2
MANTAMRLRLISRGIVLALVVLVSAIIVIHGRATQPSAPASPKSSASRIDLGGAPAPAFTLTDQSGAQVSLAALAGKPVVLTFLYTHCPDECPLTAEKLHAAVAALGPDAQRVAWVAVSVDPMGDTPAAAASFVAAHHLTGYMRYLVGTQQQLAPVWDAYHVAVQPSGDAAAQMGSVSHSVGVYLLDAHGRERAFYDTSFSSDDVVSDLRALLGR